MAGLITALILIPLVGAVALFVGRWNARWVVLGFNALSGFYALMLWNKFDSTAGGAVAIGMLALLLLYAWLA